MNPIRVAIETRLKGFTDSQVPPIPVAWEGVPFTPPVSGFYIQAFFLPSTTINPNVGAIRRRETGGYQINIYAKDGVGSNAIEALSDQIVNLFPVFPKFDAVSIEQTPSVQVAFVEKDWRVIPIRMKYRYES